MSKPYTETKRFKKLEKEYLKNDDEFSKQLAALREENERLKDGLLDIANKSTQAYNTLAESHKELLDVAKTHREYPYVVKEEIDPIISRAEKLIKESTP